MNMCNKAIANIAQALSFNETVKYVDFGGWLSSQELSVFLFHYVMQPSAILDSGLDVVLVGERAIPGERENGIIHIINFARLLLGRNFQVIRWIDANYQICYFGFKTYEHYRNEEFHGSDY